MRQTPSVCFVYYVWMFVTAGQIDAQCNVVCDDNKGSVTAVVN